MISLLYWVAYEDVLKVFKFHIQGVVVVQHYLVVLGCHLILLFQLVVLKLELGDLTFELVYELVRLKVPCCMVGPYEH